MATTARSRIGSSPNRSLPAACDACSSGGESTTSASASVGSDDSRSRIRRPHWANVSVSSSIEILSTRSPKRHAHRSTNRAAAVVAAVSRISLRGSVYVHAARSAANHSLRESSFRPNRELTRPIRFPSGIPWGHHAKRRPSQSVTASLYEPGIPMVSFAPSVAWRVSHCSNRRARTPFAPVAGTGTVRQASARAGNTS